MKKTGFLRSLHFFFRSVTFAANNFIRQSEYDILFYYPSHFNRSKSGENPYFLPLLKACDNAGIRYLVLEEPVAFHDPKRNANAVPSDILLLLTIVLRKMLPLKFFGPWRRREWLIGKIVKILTLRRMQFHTFITISQSFVEHVRGMGQEIAIFDLQHGTFHTEHETLFDAKGVTARHVTENRLNFLLYGQGFKTLLEKNDSKDYYRTHTFVIGNPLKTESPKQITVKKRTRVLISLQFMDFSDDCPDCNLWMKKTLGDFLKLAAPIVQQHHLTLTLKHHPRFDGSVSLQEILPPNCSVTIESDKPASVLLHDTLVHLTFNSSTLLEASAIGVPTLLLQNSNDLLSPTFYTEELHYPIAPMKPKEVASKIAEYVENPELYDHTCETVVKWQNDYFEPFDEKKFLDAVLGICKGE